MCFSYEKYKNKYQEVSVRASEGSVVKILLLSPAGLNPVSGIHSWEERTDFPRVESSPPLALIIFLPPLPHTSLSLRVLERFVQLCSPQRTAAFTSVPRSSRNGTFPWDGLSQEDGLQHSACSILFMPTEVSCPSSSSRLFHNHQQVLAECVVEGWLRSGHSKGVGTG